jgi:hypothetical protein
MDKDWPLESPPIQTRWTRPDLVEIERLVQDVLKAYDGLKDIDKYGLDEEESQPYTEAFKRAKAALMKKIGGE